MLNRVYNQNNYTVKHVYSMNISSEYKQTIQRGCLFA